MLFDDSPGFDGFPPEAFAVFSIPDRAKRRRAILERFHPGLSVLGDRIVAKLGAGRDDAYHAHLPKLNWPPGYQPFCTWLAVSREAHGYQNGPQLNLGVHADHVAVRLGWDTQADGFGRFEFLCRHGGLAAEMRPLIEEHGMTVRVYAAAPWPVGSRATFETRNDLAASFDEVQRRGVWWELGRRWGLPRYAGLLASPSFADEAVDSMSVLQPLYERIVGARHAP